MKPRTCIVTTLTLIGLAAQAAQATIPPAHESATRGSLDYCADPGYCGGGTTLTGGTVRRAEATARTFALTWASNWNTWAAAHKVRERILTVGCNYLSTEHYYLCAVRVRFHAPSVPSATCGLVVVEPRTQPDPSDQVENALKTTCHIFSTYPRQVVT
jgi:hypothetical protein